MLGVRCLRPPPQNLRMPPDWDKHGHYQLTVKDKDLWLSRRGSEPVLVPVASLSDAFKTDAKYSDGEIRINRNYSWLLAELVREGHVGGKNCFSLLARPGLSPIYFLGGFWVPGVPGGPWAQGAKISKAICRHA
jgi:hypothetical protein